MSDIEITYKLPNSGKVVTTTHCLMTDVSSFEAAMEQLLGRYPDAPSFEAKIHGPTTFSFKFRNGSLDGEQVISRGKILLTKTYRVGMLLHTQISDDVRLLKLSAYTNQIHNIATGEVKDVKAPVEPICPVCGYENRTLDSLRIHIRNKHDLAFNRNTGETMPIKRVHRTQ